MDDIKEARKGERLRSDVQTWQIVKTLYMLMSCWSSQVPQPDALKMFPSFAEFQADADDDDNDESFDDIRAMVSRYQ